MGLYIFITNQFLNVPGNGCTLDIPRRDGELERGFLVGDLDRRGLGRVKELKSRFSNKPLSLWRTRNGLLWFARVSSGLGSGVLVSLRREGEGDRGTCLEPVGLTDRRLVLNVLFVRRSSTPESWNNRFFFSLFLFIFSFPYLLGMQFLSGTLNQEWLL